MALTSMPTSRDIYLQAGGQKIAVAQGYRVQASRQVSPVEAFGSTLPVELATGSSSYRITLTRLLFSQQASGDDVDFYSLSDFSVVVVKPDRRIEFSGCQWASITESIKLGEGVVEEAVILARRRSVSWF